MHFVLTSHKLCDIIKETHETCDEKGVKNVNAKLVDFRKKEGYSIKEMAERIGVSKSYYEKIEYGERSASYNFIVKFVSVFPEANVDILFFEQNTHDLCAF